MSERIRAALDRFEVPYSYDSYLFCLPALYVAIADGKVSIREMMSVSWYSLRLGLVEPKADEKPIFERYIKNSIQILQRKSRRSDLELLADAVNDLLDTYSPSQAGKIRQAIHRACTKAAQASGPDFTELVSDAERDMLNRIFAQL